MEETSKDRPWLLFLGVVLLLIGVYGTLRTVVNFIAFEKYPIGGVFSFGLAESTGQYQREADCVSGYYYPTALYYKEDGMTPRQPTIEEERLMVEQKQQTAIQLENCIAGVGEARDAAKVNDLSQSILFLLLGGAVWFGRRIFRHKSFTVSL